MVKPSSRWGALLSVAAVIAAVLIITQFILPHIRSKPAINVAGLAILSRTSHAVWAEGTAIPQRGRALKAGVIRLTSGAVQIDFSRGARVVLEGPAELNLISDNEAELRSGKLRANVPVAAHGFAIRGPSFVATDRGTEFGCSVPASGEPEVHVFQGAVDLKTATASVALMLSENHAVRIETGNPIPIPARPEAFLSEQELNARERIDLGDRFTAWRLLSRELSRRPSVVLHLDLERENDWSRTLVDRSGHGAGASIVGCEWTEGRWPGKSALEFKRPDDRVRLSIPGKFNSLTLMAWVRVDRVPPWQAGLLMSDSLRPGDVHWYLYRDGSFGLGVHSGREGEARGWRHVHSAPVFRPENLGTWVFLASVFDSQTGSVSHYFNGRVVSSEGLDVRTPLRFDTCEIGNRAAIPVEESERERVRRFEGRIDEFAVFAEAMPAADIQRIYDAGRPGMAAPR